MKTLFGFALSAILMAAITAIDPVEVPITTAKTCSTQTITWYGNTSLYTMIDNANNQCK